jgi:hypothetical protein
LGCFHNQPADSQLGPRPFVPDVGLPDGSSILLARLRVEMRVLETLCLLSGKSCV